MYQVFHDLAEWYMVHTSVHARRSALRQNSCHFATRQHSSGTRIAGTRDCDKKTCIFREKYGDIQCNGRSVKKICSNESPCRVDGRSIGERVPRMHFLSVMGFTLPTRAMQGSTVVSNVPGEYLRSPAVTTARRLTAAYCSELRSVDSLACRKSCM
jgi:hypothetical protein